jgi:hypothetical protein
MGGNEEEWRLNDMVNNIGNHALRRDSGRPW